MHVVLSVQARLGSTRLPGKVMMTIGPSRIVEWVVDRCEAASVPDEVVLTVGDQPENAALTELCERRGWRYIVGPEADLLERHRRVAATTDADVLVRITADCPFVPPAEIDRLIDVHRDGDNRYTTNVDESMPVGTAVDVIDADLLETLSAADETHPVEPLRDDSDRWGTVVDLPPRWQRFGDVHVAVDTPADYWTLIDAYDAVGADPEAVVEWMAGEK